MKNRPQWSKYQPGHRGRPRVRITMAQTPDGLWHASLWERGTGHCCFSTRGHADQREAYTLAQAWIREQGYHKETRTYHESL